jgi:hypothetical protein
MNGDEENKTFDESEVESNIFRQFELLSLRWLNAFQ